MSEVPKHEDPFDSSLCGEYTRILLAGFATCSGLFWLVHLMLGTDAVVMVIANAIVLTIAIGSFSYLATIGDFISSRAAQLAGIKCMFVEKDPSSIQELLDKVLME